jgi:hypothetical protein
MLFEKIFSKVSTLGREGSNDTGLKSLSYPGVEHIKGSRVQTDNLRLPNVQFWSVLCRYEGLPTAHR